MAALDQQRTLASLLRDIRFTPESGFRPTHGLIVSCQHMAQEDLLDQLNTFIARTSSSNALGFPAPANTLPAVRGREVIGRPRAIFAILYALGIFVANSTLAPRRQHDAFARF
jgi:hypothetical protein